MTTHQLALSDKTLAAIRAALIDAADYRGDNGGDCSWCEAETDGPCADHRWDYGLADAYSAALAELPEAPDLHTFHPLTELYATQA